MAVRAEDDSGRAEVQVDIQDFGYSPGSCWIALEGSAVSKTFVVAVNLSTLVCFAANGGAQSSRNTPDFICVERTFDVVVAWRHMPLAGSSAVRVERYRDTSSCAAANESECALYTDLNLRVFLWSCTEALCLLTTGQARTDLLRQTDLRQYLDKILNHCPYNGEKQK